MPELCSNKKKQKILRRSLFVLTLVLSLVLMVLLGLIIWQMRPTDDPNVTGQTEPAPILTLPQSIQLLTPNMPASVAPVAEDYVAGLEGTGISVSFASQPVLEEGWQTVELFFSNGKAHCVQQTRCYFFKMELSVSVDKSQNWVPDVRDFVTDESVTVAFEEVPKLDTIGEKTVTILCDGKPYSVCYLVRESDSPKAVPCRVVAEIGTVPDPSKLVEQIEDESEVTVTYKETPVLTIVGELEVTLVLTDAFGNTTEIESVIDVVPAAAAPQFEGLDDMWISVGDSISYKKGVSAVDPQDGTVTFTVDAAAVDRNHEGTYIAYYSATDSDGNTTIVPRKIVVKTVDQASVEAMVQKILKRIITDDMTLDQKINAVYKYTKKNVQYVGASNKESIWKAAYEGLSTGTGDCYTYYAINRIMFTMLGIENLEVRRIGGTSNHWWNLVLFEDGLYYHVDSCPVAVKMDSINHGKMTEADLVAYTNNEGVINRRPNFYVYDKTLPEYENIDIAQ